MEVLLTVNVVLEPYCAIVKIKKHFWMTVIKIRLYRKFILSLCHPPCTSITKLNKQIHVYFNPLPNKPWFLHVPSTNLLKTLWEKEKLLVMSNFSFSHSVFYTSDEQFAILINFEIVVCKLFQYGRVSNLSFGKR